MQLVESDFPGYYLCKEYPGLAANRNGDVIDAVSGKSLIKQPKRNDYLNVTTEGRTYRAHLVTLSTFKEKPVLQVGEMLVCNHLDGVKWHNNIMNIEWTSQSQNTYHAYMMGLNWKSTRVWMKDLRTGEITEHYSLRDAAKEYAIPHTQISKWLNQQTRAFPLERFYDAATETIQFANLTSEDVGKAYALYEGLVVWSHDESEKYLFESTVAAAKFLRVAYHNLMKDLSRLGFYNRDGWFACWPRDYTGDTTACETIPKEKRRKTGGSPRKGIKAIDLNGEVRFYKDRFVMADIFKVHPTTISTAVTKGGEWRGMKLEYAEYPVLS